MMRASLAPKSLYPLLACTPIALMGAAPPLPAFGPLEQRTFCVWGGVGYTHAHRQKKVVLIYSPNDPNLFPKSTRVRPGDDDVAGSAMLVRLRASIQAGGVASGKQTAVS